MAEKKGAYVLFTMKSRPTHDPSRQRPFPLPLTRFAYPHGDKTLFTFLKHLLFCFIDAGFAWSQRRATTLSAAISYYTMLSLAPLLLIATAIVSFLIGTTEAVNIIVNQIELFFNPDVANLVQSLIQTTSRPTSITLVTIVSVAVTLFAASGVFNQMQVAFNVIWDVDDHEEGIRLTIVRRLVAFLLVLVVGIGMVALIILNVVISVLEVIIARFVDLGIISSFEDDVVVFIAMFVLLSLMYKLIPSVSIAWRDIWSGALVAAVLFTFSRYFITLYLRSSTLVPTYGAASSLVVLLIWVYFAALIILYGSAFSRAYAYRLGSRSEQESLITTWSEQLVGGLQRVRQWWREKRDELTSS